MQSSDALDRLHALRDPSTAVCVDRFAHPGWETTLIEVPGRHWVDQLAGGTLDAAPNSERKRTCLRAADVLRRFPAGLLASADAAVAE